MDPTIGLRGPRQHVAAAAILVTLVGAFSLHASRYGGWVVDDAGISMAYAINLADGHGLVAQPGARAVEGFSNPLWTLILAGFAAVGTLGTGAVAGIPAYLIVIKGLAIAMHAVVLVCAGFLIHRILTVALAGRPPSIRLTLCLWTAAGSLLALNPSYVIWMTSGLENPLLAAEVSGIAALAIHAVLRPTRGSVVSVGLLCGLAALTRPDGAVYVLVVGSVAAFAPGTLGRRRRSWLWPGIAGFAGPFLVYLLFRVVYFGAWLPNTAVAKSQGMPSFSDIGRLGEVGRAFGWPLTLVAGAGCLLAGWRFRTTGNTCAMRVGAVALTVLAASLIAFVVLRPDWMTEFRFLTPAWPLLSITTTLGAAQLVVSARSMLFAGPRTSSSPPGLAVAVAVSTAMAASLIVVVPTWWRRSQTFRDAPTVALCRVAERYGVRFNTAAGILRLDPHTTSLLLPDLGGTLLVSHLRVVDLAGLTDRTIATMLRAGDPAALARYVLVDLRPTFIHIHDYWSVVSGLGGNPQLAHDYVELDPGDWVRRDVLLSHADVAAAGNALEDGLDTTRPPSPRDSCGNVRFM